MKIFIAKCLFAGSLLLGLAVIACENTNRKDNETMDPDSLPAVTEESPLNGDTLGALNTDTTYDSTSDTVYKRR